jgi:hypothetical protein
MCEAEVDIMFLLAFVAQQPAQGTEYELILDASDC